MEDFNNTKVLPEEFVDKSVANHLYRIGLCLTNDQTISSQRKWFNKPIVVFTIFVVFLIKTIINVFTDKRNKLVLLFLGDWNYLILREKQYINYIG